MRKHFVSNFLRRSVAIGFVAAGFSLASQNASAGIGLQTIAEGLVSPNALASLDESRMLIADQAGSIYLLRDGSLQEEPFLALRDRMADINEGYDERGLLGLALHPDFANNRKFYVYYSAPGRDGLPEGWDHTSHISEFQVLADNPDQADSNSERLIFEIDQPQSNHNGGRLVFGPDGFLYIGVGDGGAANDQALGHGDNGNGQDINKPNGKILRIDINGDPFNIPPDNPYVGKEGHDAIYAIGLRNPWGLTFDRGGERELFVSDVGQNRFEEVNIVTKGGNYGWRIREGMHGFDPARARDLDTPAPKVDANGNLLIDPIVEYKNMGAHRRDPEAIGISVTGGYVYRGSAIPELEGQYIFADWSTSFGLPSGIMLAATKEGDSWNLRKLALDDHPDGNIDIFIMGFGEDSNGELYVLGNKINGLQGTSRPELRQGIVYKLIRTE